MLVRILLVLLCTMFAHDPARAGDDPVDQLYKQNCSSCHGVNRLGGVGPALLPGNPAATQTGSRHRRDQ